MNLENISIPEYRNRLDKQREETPAGGDSNLTSPSKPDYEKYLFACQAMQQMLRLMINKIERMM